MTRLNACDGCEAAPIAEKINGVIEGLFPEVADSSGRLVEMFADFKAFRAGLEASGTLTDRDRAKLDQAAARISDSADNTLPTLAFLGFEVEEVILSSNAIDCTASELPTICPRIKTALDAMGPLIHQASALAEAAARDFSDPSSSN